MDTIGSHLARKSDNFLLLRIVAALMVIYGHSFPLTRDMGLSDIFLRHGWRIYSGDIAVDLFFVISGFMVSGSFLARSNLAAYLTARLLRIVPAYLFFLLSFAFAIGPLLSSLPAASYFANPEPLVYVLRNLRFSPELAWSLPGLFSDHRLTTVNGVLWTLPAEMRMYLFVAAMGVLGFLANRRLGLVLFLGLFAAALLDAQFLPLHTAWVKLSGFFCLGVLAQLFKERIQVRHDVMLVLLAITYISYNTKSYFFLLALSIAYFAFWFAYRTPVLKLERFGDPSYGIYLWGWPAQQILIQVFPGINAFNNFLLAAPMAIVMGYVSWYLIERPALSLKDNAQRLASHPWLARVFPKPGVSP